MRHQLSKRIADRVFQDTVDAYRRKFGFDLSYMRYALDKRPHYRDGSIVRGKPKGWSAGCLTNGGLVYINPDFGSVFNYYGMPGDTDVESFGRQIMGHEIAHEIWREHADPKFRRRIVREAKKLGFETPYTRTVNGKNYDEELFCEYMSHLNSSGGKVDPRSRKNFSRVVVYRR